MGYQTDAMYGDSGNYSAIPADMLSNAADGSVDWGAVLAGGIRGAAQQAIATRVNDVYASGQLATNQAVQQQNANQLRNLLLIGGVIYLLAKG